MKNKAKNIDIYTHGFKIHLPQLLKEITNNNGIGALKIPLQSLQRYLISISERAIELDDPILNRLMCELTLYDQVDPHGESYDKDLIHRVIKKAKNFKKAQ